MRHFSTYATKDITELATAIAVALKEVFVEDTTEEVIKTRYNHTIFKNSFTYTSMDEMGNEYTYDPFAISITELGAGYLGGIFCNEMPLFHIPYTTLLELLPDLDYYTESNPLINAVITDYLTYRLNEEQSWAKPYCKPVEHLAQNYVSLAKLVKAKVPELNNAYGSLLYEVNSAKEDFIAGQITEAQDKTMPYGNNSVVVNISAQYAAKLYELKGLAAENKLIQDFIDRPLIQDALNDILVSIGKVLGNTLKIESEVAETSLRADKGYDVYHVSVDKNKLVLRNVGDYRILHWELNK